MIFLEYYCIIGLVVSVGINIIAYYIDDQKSWENLPWAILFFGIIFNYRASLWLNICTFIAFIVFMPFLHIILLYEMIESKINNTFLRKDYRKTFEGYDFSFSPTMIEKMETFLKSNNLKYNKKYLPDNLKYAFILSLRIFSSYHVSVLRSLSFQQNIMEMNPIGFKPYLAEWLQVKVPLSDALVISIFHEYAKYLNVGGEEVVYGNDVKKFKIITKNGLLYLTSTETIDEKQQNKYKRETCIIEECDF